MKQLPGIEALRGLLSLVVFVGHVWLMFVGAANGDTVTDAHVATLISSRLAVVLFFVVSGYVIARSIGENARRHGGAFDPLDYALARLFRILPPVALTIAVTWLLYVVLLYAGLYFVSWQSAERMVYITEPGQQLQALATLTIAGNLMGPGNFNGPLWSLVYELRLYVFAGLLALAPRRPWVLILLAAYVWALECLPVAENARQWALYAAFGLGSAAYGLRDWRPLRAVGVACALVLVWIVTTLEFRHARWALDTVPWLALQLALAAAFACALTWLGGSPRLGALRWFGRVSFTLYILHFPVLLAIYFALFNLARPLVQKGTVQWTAVAAGVIGFAVCAAAALWVERPTAQRRAVEALVRRWRAVSAGVPAASRL